MINNFKQPNINFAKFKDMKVKISNIPPLDVAFQNMALSDYELLVATIYKLNELIENTNSYTELINEVLKWVINEGLEQSVVDQLSIWLNDGTLDSVINDILFESKLDKGTFNTFLNDTYQIAIDNINNSLTNNETELTKKAEKTYVDGEIATLDLEKLNKQLFFDQKNIVDNYLDLQDNDFTYKKINVKNVDMHIVLFDGQSKLKPSLKHFSNGKKVKDIDEKIGINAGYFDTNDLIPRNPLIINGEIIDGKDGGAGSETLVWNENEWTSLPRSISAQNILAQGYTNALPIWEQTITDGVVTTTSDGGLTQRSYLGITHNDEFFIVASGGRTSEEKGLRIDDSTIAIKNNLPVKHLFSLDGGGSTQMKVANLNLIQPDTYSNEYRKVSTIFTFEDVKMAVNSGRIDAVEKNLNNVKNKLEYKTGSSQNAEDLDELIGVTGTWYLTSSTLNKPNNLSQGFVTCYTNNSLNTTLQILLPKEIANRDYANAMQHAHIMLRTYQNNQWEEWVIQGKEIMYLSTSNIDNLKVNSTYYIGNTTIGHPTGSGGGGYVDMYCSANGKVMQRYTDNAGSVYIRHGVQTHDGTTTPTWYEWVKI